MKLPDFEGPYVVELVGLDVFGNLIRVLIGPFDDAEAAVEACGESDTAVIAHLNPPRVRT